MEFLLQLFAEFIQGEETETITDSSNELELVEEQESAENIFGMMHFH